MKKLMTIMLGLSLVIGATAAMTFAQTSTRQDEPKKKKGKKKTERVVISEAR